MRKINLFSAVLSLFLLVSASITWAQTTSFISGMVVTDYPTQYGNVKVFLPGGDTLRSGQLITGTVTAEPHGKNEREKNKNWAELMKFSLDVAGKKIGLTGKATPFDFFVPQGRANMAEMQLWNGNGPRLLASTQFYVSDNKPWIRNISPQEWGHLSNAAGPTVSFSVDPHLPVIGEPFKIYSSGNLSPTQFDFTDGSGKSFSIRPFCGSSYESFFTLPSTTQAGTIITTIKCSANDGPTETVTLKFNAIKTEYKVQDPNIRKGKQTQLDGWINGLPADPAKAPYLVLQNRTTSVVNMMQGNFQQLQVIPTTNADGTNGFHFQRTLTGLMDGTFTISATLHEPPDADDPFRSQLEILQTPEQYNNWADALKRDLNTFAYSQPTTDAGNKIKSYLSHIIENIPRASIPAALEQVKAQTLTYLRTTNLPRSFPDWAECTYEVYKVASSGLRRLETEPKNLQFIPWGVIQWAMQKMQDKGERLQDAALRYRSRDVMYQVDKMKQQVSPEPDQLKKINISLEILNNIVIEVEPGNYSDIQRINVHADIGRYKSEYFPPDYEHASEEGPDISSYLHKEFKHAKEAGPDKSRYVFERKHASVEGPNKSTYVRLYFDHVAEEGPDKSKYVDRSTKIHAWMEGPDKSKYLDYDMHHEEKGADKSKYSDKWKEHQGEGWEHASVEGPDKSKYLHDHKHASEEGPNKSYYEPKSLTHVAEEGLDKSRYVNKTINKHAAEEGFYKSSYVDNSFTHVSEEGPDKSRYLDKTYWKHVTAEDPDKSKYRIVPTPPGHILSGVDKSRHRRGKE